MAADEISPPSALDRIMGRRKGVAIAEPAPQEEVVVAPPVVAEPVQEKPREAIMQSLASQEKPEQGENKIGPGERSHAVRKLREASLGRGPAQKLMNKLRRTGHGGFGGRGNDSGRNDADATGGVTEHATLSPDAYARLSPEAKKLLSTLLEDKIAAMKATYPNISEFPPKVILDRLWSGGFINSRGVSQYYTNDKAKAYGLTPVLLEMLPKKVQPDGSVQFFPKELEEALHSHPRVIDKIIFDTAGHLQPHEVIRSLELRGHIERKDRYGSGPYEVKSDKLSKTLVDLRVAMGKNDKHIPTVGHDTLRNAVIENTPAFSQLVVDPITLNRPDVVSRLWDKKLIGYGKFNGKDVIKVRSDAAQELLEAYGVGVGSAGVMHRESYGNIYKSPEGSPQR